MKWPSKAWRNWGERDKWKMIEMMDDGERVEDKGMGEAEKKTS